jgi:hypothetical protein
MFYTEEMKKTIRNLAGVLPPKVIGQEIGRTENQVRHWCTNNKISVAIKKIGPELDNMIKALAHLPTRQIVKTLGIHGRVVQTVLSGGREIDYSIARYRPGKDKDEMRYPEMTIKDCDKWLAIIKDCLRKYEPIQTKSFN